MEKLYKILTSLLPIRCPNVNNGEVLFHASSVGEVNSLYPLISNFKKYRLSVFTKSGFKYASSLGLNAFRFPFDKPSCIEKLLHNVKLLVIAETEIWPNLITISKGRGIPVVIVNATLTERSYRFYRSLKFLGKTFESIDAALCQSEEDAKKFRSLGVKYVEVIGNLKFDSVERPVKDINLKRFKLKGSFLFANIRGKEIKPIVRVINNVIGIIPDAKFIIAPRHLENVRKISKILKHLGIEFSLRTKDEDTRVLILNTMGEMWSVYRFCVGCFVGGTLKKYGGHSLIEPAYWKLPTSCGIYTYKQPYVSEMIKMGAVYLVKSEDELTRFVVRIFRDVSFRRELSERIYNFYKKNTGISKKVLSEIERWLK